MRRSSKSLHVGMMASRESDQTTRTRSSRYQLKRLVFCMSLLRTDRGYIAELCTYDECGVLLPVSMWKHHHRLNDLNACVRIDIDTLVVVPTDDKKRSIRSV